MTRHRSVRYESNKCLASPTRVRHKHILTLKCPCFIVGKSKRKEDKHLGERETELKKRASHLLGLYLHRQPLIHLHHKERHQKKIPCCQKLIIFIDENPNIWYIGSELENYRNTKMYMKIGNDINQLIVSKFNPNKVTKRKLSSFLLPLCLLSRLDSNTMALLHYIR